MVRALHPRPYIPNRTPRPETTGAGHPGRRPTLPGAAAGVQAHRTRCRQSRTAGGGEYVNPEQQLHRHALYQAEAGDVVVVDARGNLRSGVFGNMMLTYLKGKGGLGIVVDGAIRDFPIVKDLGLGLWLRGVTPNFHTQTDIYPYAVNVPIACGEVLVVPGDIIVADDDGAVVVPAALAEEPAEHARHHAEWEDFSREKLEQGADLRKYYPLNEEGWEEYRRFCTERGRPDPGERPTRRRNVRDDRTKA